MDSRSSAVVLSLILAGTLIAVFIWRQPPSATRLQGEVSLLKSELEVLRTSIEALTARLDATAQAPRGDRSAAAFAGETVYRRLEALEKELGEIRRTLEGPSPFPPIQEEDFASADGYLLADSYLGRGEFARAGGGYVEFLAHNPEHPDALDIMRRASDAFWRAGDAARAIELQQEILQGLPGPGRASELLRLAILEKNAVRWDDAVRHARESAEAATSDEERLMARGYHAWFIQLFRGEEAGLAAYDDTMKLAEALGLSEGNQAGIIRHRMEKIRAQLGASNR